MIPPNNEGNYKIVSEELENISSNFNKKCVILLDADRTLCEIDTSRILNELVNINFEEIKGGFVKHGYTYPGFKNMAEIYSRLSLSDYIKFSQETADQVELYPGVFEFLNESKEFADLCIVTSGVKRIWENILKRIGLEHVNLIGGTHSDLDNYIIGRDEKGQIAEFFSQNGQISVAFGDSDVDSLMLKAAKHAIVVVNHRNNADLLPHIKDHSSLYQISFKDYYHDGIKVSDFRKISNLIKNLISRG
ncbi:MAG: haloacid dehalogenase-like hydrolase [Promethearchaeota archaeon]